MSAFLLASPAGAAMRQIRTRHYVIHTDVDRELADDLAKRMDAMYTEYDRRLADFRTGDARRTFDVHVFVRQRDYTRFTGNALTNSGGVFMADRGALAVFLEGQGRDGLRRTLQHEAFHQFAFTTFTAELPIWLNEGLAQLFEESVWTGEAFLLNEVPPFRVRQLREDMRARRLVPFERFIATTHAQWSRTLFVDPDRGGAQYNQAWAMVYFLVNARDDAGQPLYRQRLVYMLDQLNRGADGPAAFRAAFGENYVGFQDRFVGWARVLEPTVAAAVIERQEVLADLLRALTAQGKRFRDIASLRREVINGLYQMGYTRGRITWQSDPDPTIYFRDLAGRELSEDDLYLEPRHAAPLPDVVRHTGDRTRLRTRFYEGAEHAEYETMVESR